MGERNLTKSNFLTPETTKPLKVHAAYLGLLAVEEAWLMEAGKVRSKGIRQPYSGSQRSCYLCREPHTPFRRAGSIKVQL